MWPPFVELSRSLEHDTEIDGRILKEGTQVNIHIYALHRHPDFWDKPEVRCCDEIWEENYKGNRDDLLTPTQQNSNRQYKVVGKVTTR